MENNHKMSVSWLRKEGLFPVDKINTTDYPTQIEELDKQIDKYHISIVSTITDPNMSEVLIAYKYDYARGNISKTRGKLYIRTLNMLLSLDIPTRIVVCDKFIEEWSQECTPSGCDTLDYFREVYRKRRLKDLQEIKQTMLLPCNRPKTS